MPCRQTTHKSCRVVSHSKFSLSSAAQPNSIDTEVAATHRCQNVRFAIILITLRYSARHIKRVENSDIAVPSDIQPWLLTDRPAWWSQWWVSLSTYYKCLANAKRPCDCRVLCLRLKSSLCSCTHSISDMTSFGCRDQVCAQCAECQREIQESAGKRRIPTRVSAAADRPASHDNQTISSTWPSCCIQILTADVINIAADHEMFMTPTGELSWQRLRRSAVDFYSNKKLCYCRGTERRATSVEILWPFFDWAIDKKLC